MRIRHRFSVRSRSPLPAALALALCLAAAPAGAAGLLIADGGFGGVLEIAEHSVAVTFNNGIVVTEVTQVFRNTENRQVEALYTFPVPTGASVSNFSMWIGGKEMVGEVLEKQRAREIYDSYKQQRRDPGLLEQNDYKSFEMRIFPIGPGAEQRVQVTYYQELDFDHDEATYVYPLATLTRRDVDSRTTGRFALDLNVSSAVPVVDIGSPSHGGDFLVVRHSDQYYQASLETDGGDLSRDVVLVFRTARPRTGLDLVTSRQAGDDGFFLLTLTAGEELATKVQGMDYVFILDVSGSMAEEDFLIKGSQARRLDAVKTVFEDFVLGRGALRGRDGDLIGMTTFAMFADTPCPLTLDHGSLGDLLEQTEIPGWIDGRQVREDAEAGNTSLGDAIVVATDVLRRAGEQAAAGVPGAEAAKSRVMILLTDGQDNPPDFAKRTAPNPIEAARLAATLGIRVYTIGAVGSDELRRRGGYGLFGRPRAQVDEATLKEIARVSGGKYFRATDTQSLVTIYDEIDKLERTETGERVFRDDVYACKVAMLTGLALLLAELLLANTRYRRVP